MKGAIMNDFPSAQPSQVVIVGAGAWGTTLAIVAHRAGNRVALASHHEDTMHHLQKKRTHPRSLLGVVIPHATAVISVDELEVNEHDLVILAIPVQRLRAALADLRNVIGAATIVSAAKGIEVDTLMTPASIVKDVLGDVGELRLAALSGPNLALEIALGHPATTVVASNDRDTAGRIQHCLTSDTFRVYTSNDVIGVEMGGALKNVVAIGAGIADGLGAGQNAKAAFMTRGIAEIARLGVACGAEPLTFAGLSGIGDLIATCGSERSRNHTVGRALAEGRSLDEITSAMTETAEGVDTTRAAYRLASNLGVDCPIIHGMHDVLFSGVTPVEAARQLMTREPTTEAI
jgi:glycerol-3-phosphate dehydrogenase (NAD(P)+)